MSDDGRPDFAQYFEDARAEILASGATRAELRTATREILRSLREALPDYKRVQEPSRYNMAALTITELEEDLARLENANPNDVDDDDYVELLAQARTQMYSTSLALRGILDQAQATHHASAPPPAARRGGCVRTLVLLFILAAVGWIAVVALGLFW